MDIVERADYFWRGETMTAEKVNLMAPGGHLATITEGVAFLPSFGNVTVIDTDDGLVLIDTGSAFAAEELFTTIREWSQKPVHTAIFTHGHFDHIAGLGPFEAESLAKGWPAITVLAHENVPRRFDRYQFTHGLNQTVNRRQFRLPNLLWPTEYRYPDETYTHELSRTIGGLDFYFRHEKGETDDATVTWIPSKKVLCSGDMFVWSSPNAGNPQKVPRFPLEWAQGLRRMAALGAEYFLPGHGLPIFGAERIAQTLNETAEYLESIVNQTISLMNEGLRFTDILPQVRPPAHLADRTFLQPIYDEPEFIVHNVWRLYAGWWQGDPSTLKPVNDRVLAREMVQLMGGVAPLASRVAELIAEDTDDADRLAGHLIETAWLAEPQNPEIQALRIALYTQRGARATSTMARGVFAWAVRETSGEQL